MREGGAGDGTQASESPPRDTRRDGGGLRDDADVHRHGAGRRQLAMTAGKAATREHEMSRAWSEREHDESSMSLRCVRRLRWMLGKSADDPTDMLNEPRVSYPLGEAEGEDGVSW